MDQERGLEAGVPELVVIATKCVIPPAHAALVARPRLFVQLDQGLRRKLTLVSAPAGFGKTSLLAGWLAALGAQGGAMEAPVPSPAPRAPDIAWLSLDAGDDEPLRFWFYILTALQRVQPALVARARELLLELQPRFDAMLASLINAGMGLAHDVVLILDDYHQISAPAIHAALADLLQHLPPRLHVVISSRADPPLPIARLRVRDELAELRAADLRFTHAEVEAFLRSLGLNLSPERVATLEARTEGWVAGLRLAALSVRGLPQAEPALAQFTGSHHYVVDYLGEEILQRQPETIQTFLLHTSVVDQLSAPLCDTLLASGDSQQILELLERQMLVEALDGERRWFRYHQLFAAFLRSQLEKQPAAPLELLHTRASLWYANNGMEIAAVDHALAARDYEWAATLIEYAAHTMFLRGDISTIRRWLAALPEALIVSWPHLCTLRAWALISTQQLGAAALWLDRAERALEAVRQQAELQPAHLERERGRLAATHAALALLRGDMPRAIAHSRDALALLPLADRILRTLIAFNLANAYGSLGDAAASERALQHARGLGQIADDVQVLLLVASLDMMQGRLHSAAKGYREIIRRAVAQTADPIWQAGLASAYVGLGELLYEWNDLGGAAEYLQQAIEIGERRAASLTDVDATVALARVRIAADDLDAAVQLLHQAHVLAERHASPQALGPIEAVWARLALRQGRLAEAEQRVQRAGPGEYGPLNIFHDDEYAIQAQVQIALGQTESALELLGGWMQAAQSGGHVRSLLRAMLLQSLAYAAAGDTAAYARLRDALALAAPEGYVRTFADAGAPMRLLLTRLREEAAEPGAELAGYLDELLWSFEPAGSVVRIGPPPLQTLVEPLTDRELAVLRCLAAGLSNTEIAAELTVAVSTVRTHIKNIYGKLGVRNRVEAVTSAQDLRLLSLGHVPIG